MTLESKANMTGLTEIEVDNQVGKKSKAAAKAKSLTSLDAAILRDIDVTLTAVLGRGKTTVRQLLELSSGEVIELDTPLDGRIELQLNGQVIALGEIVAVDDKFGVRITQIVAKKE